MAGFKDPVQLNLTPRYTKSCTTLTGLPAYTNCGGFLIRPLENIGTFYKAKAKRLYCAFIDYEKAFDSVNRSALWIKLINNGVNGRILQVIMNLYLNCKSCIRNNGYLSE